VTGTTTAYLSDGRHVEVPRPAANEWAIAAADLETTLSLGDWYTNQGERHLDAILGEPAPDESEDWPRCEHYLQGGPRVRVTNVSQSAAFDPTRPHASAIVCDARACVLDGLAWVERSTGESGVWIGDDYVTHTEAPPAVIPVG